MVAGAFNASIWKAETGGSLWVPNQPGLHTKFQGSKGYQKGKTRLKKKNNKMNQVINPKQDYTTDIHTISEF